LTETDESMKATPAPSSEAASCGDGEANKETKEDNDSAEADAADTPAVDVNSLSFLL